MVHLIVLERLVLCLCFLLSAMFLFALSFSLSLFPIQQLISTFSALLSILFFSYWYYYFVRNCVLAPPWCSLCSFMFSLHISVYHSNFVPPLAFSIYLFLSLRCLHSCSSHCRFCRLLPPSFKAAVAAPGPGQPITSCVAVHIVRRRLLLESGRGWATAGRRRGGKGRAKKRTKEGRKERN